MMLGLKCWNSKEVIVPVFIIVKEGPVVEI